MNHAMLQKSSKQQIDAAKEAADWLVDAIATALQDRRFLRGDPECETAVVEAIIQNGVIACLRAMHKKDQPHD
jgi:hypothetical protein